jgi:integrase
VFRVGPKGIYYVGYSLNGRVFRRSTHQTSEAVARRILAAELRKTATGYTPDEDRVKFEDGIERIRAHRRDHNLRSTDLDQRARHLARAFAKMRLVDVTTGMVERYKEARLKEDAARATINQELAVLRQMYRLCRLTRQPEVKLFPPKTLRVRQDFLNQADFFSVRDGLPEDMRDIVTFMYLSSWREGQVAALEWRDVNLREGVVTARGETTKTGDPHRIPLVGPLAEVIERAKMRRRLDCPFVFHRDGEPFRLRGGKAPLRVAWRRACEAAGFKGHVLHCLRRSGVRNMINQGVDPMLAMRASGHKSMSMLARYRIVNLEDLRRGFERTFAGLAELPDERKVATTITTTERGNDMARDARRA